MIDTPAVLWTEVTGERLDRHAVRIEGHGGGHRQREAGGDHADAN